MNYRIMLMVASLFLSMHIGAQNKYNRKSQEKLFPPALGKVFMGMNLQAFQQLIPIDSATLNDDYAELRVMDIPFDRQDIQSLSARFSSLSTEEKTAMIQTVEISRKEPDGYVFKEMVKRIIPSRIAAKGKLYELRISFKKGFDLDAWAKKFYGASKDIHKPEDGIYIYDVQWGQRTNDGLGWIIRLFRGSNTLLIAATVPGSEWGL
jgi:hypothetical protein